MEHAKKFFGAVLVVVTGLALYDLAVKPMINKVGITAPATA